MKDLNVQIQEVLPNGVTIESCKESAYLFEYSFISQNGNMANIKFYYTDKGKITKILPKVDDEFGRLLQKRFENIKNIVDKGESYSFPLPELELQYCRIKEIVESRGIAIMGFPEIFPYRQRYTFTRDSNGKNEYVVFDIGYNKEGKSYVNNLTKVEKGTNSDELAQELREVLLEFLVDKDDK